MRYLWRNGKWVPKHLAKPLHGPSIGAVMSDISERVSPIDGTVITSRSHLRHHNRAHGVIDVGDDPSLKRPPERKYPDGLKQDIARAFAERGY